MIHLHQSFSTFAEFLFAGLICYTFYKVMMVTTRHAAPPKAAKLLNFKKVRFTGEKFEFKN